jgi:SOS-response transcriptional repressor LexA
MLTLRQQKLLRYIEDYSVQRGVSPTFQEMREFLGTSSKASPHGLVQKLIERGFLERTEGRNRTLKVVRPHAIHMDRVYDIGFRAGYAAALRCRDG